MGFKKKNIVDQIGEGGHVPIVPPSKSATGVSMSRFKIMKVYFNTE